MKWYRRMYFKTFEWYRDMNGAQSWPETYAAGILGSLHVLNILAFAFAVGLPVSNSSRPYGLAGWLLVGTLISLGPPMWCCFHADQIEIEFNTEDEVVNPKGRIWVALYAVMSVSAVIVAAAFWIARYRTEYAH
jgi:hypothetical protein